MCFSLRKTPCFHISVYVAGFIIPKNSKQLKPNQPTKAQLDVLPTKINKTQKINDVTKQNGNEYINSNELDSPFSLECDEEMSDTIPNMEDVLRKFNINPDYLQIVDINDYRWYEFKVNETLSQSDSLSISQRISTLVRRTRYTHTYSVAKRTETNFFSQIER